MKKSSFLGIDVSKEKLDVCFYEQKTSVEFANTESGFRKLKNWFNKQSDGLEDLVICFEHTGLYAVPLQLFCEQEDIDYLMVNGLEVKRSLGIQRGKNDRVDSQRLARYAYLHRESLVFTQLANKNLIKLKYLLSFRSRLVRQRAGYKATLKEYKNFLGLKENEGIISSHKQLIQKLSEEIKQIEKEITSLLDNDQQINRQYQLTSSVKGIGPIVSAYMIVSTNCFTNYAKWRKYACYVGSAPFENSSGSSIQGKTKISQYANKTIKALLTNAAMAAIRYDPQLKEYYERKIQEGKLKKIVVNNVRNKLISRVFAVVKRGTPYVNVAGYAG